ncbi:MAG: HTH domain-containing protein [Planctomycetota bacterium]
MQDGNLTDNVVKIASEFADSVGLSSVAAQIYALLYISPSALSLDEISGKLHLSKSTVSQNIRILEGWEAVKNVFVKGSRKDYYEVNPNIMEIILKKLKSGLNSRMSKASANLSEIEGLVKDIKDAGKKVFYQQRLNNLKRIYQTVTTLVNMLPEKM